MSYEVKVLRKARKDIEKAPAFVRAKFVNLVRDLQDFGPILPCWRHEGGSLLVEVYYAGSRENAPY